MSEPPIVKEKPSILKEVVKENPKKTTFEKILELLSDSFHYIVIVIVAIIAYYLIKQGQEPDQLLATEAFDSV